MSVRACNVYVCSWLECFHTDNAEFEQKNSEFCKWNYEYTELYANQPSYELRVYGAKHTI
jgi:hypothetical protein